MQGGRCRNAARRAAVPKRRTKLANQGSPVGLSSAAIWRPASSNDAQALGERTHRPGPPDRRYQINRCRRADRRLQDCHRQAKAAHEVVCILALLAKAQHLDTLLIAFQIENRGCPIAGRMLRFTLDEARRPRHCADGAPVDHDFCSLQTGAFVRSEENHCIGHLSSGYHSV